MTKEEVLQGALSLNGNDRKYTVTVEGDKITIQSEFSANATGTRTGTFCCVAHLNNDNTYVETHSARDGRQSQFGKVVKVQKSISFTFGGESDAVEVKKEYFSSEEIDMSEFFHRYNIFFISNHIGSRFLQQKSCRFRLLRQTE